MVLANVNVYGIVWYYTGQCLNIHAWPYTMYGMMRCINKKDSRKKLLLHHATSDAILLSVTDVAFVE
jgi:hypothetical protein